MKRIPYKKRCYFESRNGPKILQKGWIDKKLRYQQTCSISFFIKSILNIKIAEYKYRVRCATKILFLKVYKNQLLITWFLRHNWNNSKFCTIVKISKIKKEIVTKTKEWCVITRTLWKVIRPCDRVHQNRKLSYG